jgi:hypothetical protein
VSHRENKKVPFTFRILLYSIQMAEFRTFEVGMLRDFVYQHFIKQHLRDNFSCNVKTPILWPRDTSGASMSIYRFHYERESVCAICVFYAPLGAFAKFRKSCLSVSLYPQGTTRLPLDGFS